MAQPSRRSQKRTADTPRLDLRPKVREALAGLLPSVGEDVVAAIIDEVPSYSDALSGPMGETIRTAVRIALSGFLTTASSSGDSVPATAPALQGAYELGRGEARSGRTTEALLAAYRIGARVAWREMSTAAVQAGLKPQELVEFAAMVFQWIDEVSDASAAGHTEELASSGRVRQRLLERLARLLLAGASTDALEGAADEAAWTRPETLTAALVPAAQLGPVLALISPATLTLTDLADLPDLTLLLVPDAHGHRRAALLRTLEGRAEVIGPAKPWHDALLSYERALRARSLGLTGDADEHLVQLVLRADADALADLRAAVLAPLADLRAGVAEKLTETLRSWLLHQGRRDEVAAELFVHPQTVRYRMQQLREVYGDRLDDPATLLALTVALG